MKFDGKKVLVCGMAKSGRSAALLLKRLGADVTIQDLKKKEELTELEELEEKGISLYLGKNPDAIAANQDLIVVSPGIPCELPFFALAEEAGVEVWSEIELAYFLAPCPIAAVTGTNGKTTTTALAGEILKRRYSHTAVVGNIGVPFTQEVQRMTADDWIAAEISSFQLETSHAFHPKISAVLNITPDHLNRHKTLENYIAMKEKIFQNQEASDFCILNYEDAACRKMAEKTKANIFYFSSQKELDQGIFLQNENMIVKWNGCHEVLLSVKELQILGRHNFENAMAAAAIGICAGVPLEEIRTALRQFGGVAHRIEYVATVNGVDYYNDSKGTNPDAAIRAVEAMVKPILLIGGGYDKNSQYDEWIQTFPGKVKHLVLLGATAEKIEAACQKHGFSSVTKTDSLEQAVALCAGMAKEGDCVLLSPACASWGMFDNYEQRGDLFKQIVLSKKEMGKKEN